MLLNILVTILLAFGLFFFLGGSIGILRFPDFYSRLHPAGKLDTMGLFMSMIALALYNLHHFEIATVLTSFKILLIVALVFLTSPTATHAIVDAGVRAGLTPWMRRDKGTEDDLSA